MKFLAFLPLVLVLQATSPSAGCQTPEAAPAEPAAGERGEAGVHPSSRTREGGYDLNPERRRIFDTWDTDGDGVVDGEEYAPLGGGPSHYDPNEDGTLTLQEYARYFADDAPDRDPAEAEVQGPPLPNALPPGDYSCLHVYYDAMNKRTMMDPLGTLTILPRQRYRWFEGGEGRFTYEAERGSVAWSGGAFGAQDVAESGVEWKGEDLMLKVVFQVSPQNTLTYRCYPLE